MKLTSLFAYTSAYPSPRLTVSATVVLEDGTKLEVQDVLNEGESNTLHNQILGAVAKRLQLASDMGHFVAEPIPLLEAPKEVPENLLWTSLPSK